MDNVELINMVCYYVAIASVVAGVLLGISAIWLSDFFDDTIIVKSLTTTAILFVGSALGALVTRLLVIRG